MMTILETPRRFKLTRDFWIATSVIAGLRKAVNDPIRANNRDRGNAKNFLNDIQGVAGELLALAHVETLEGVASIKHDIINFDGPVDDVDLLVETATSLVGLEAKCLLLEANKKRFLVNQTAHERSLKRGAIYYLPIVTALGADVAYVGKGIGIEILHAWKVEDFNYGDPALSTPFDEFAKTFLGDNGPRVRMRLQKAANALGTDFGSFAVLAAQRPERLRNFLHDISNAKFSTIIKDVCMAIRDE
jgi:hypothetical protein